MKWRLSRKRKKQFKKDCGIYKSHYENCILSDLFKNWEWQYHKERVTMRFLRVIIKYPSIVSESSITLWYIKHYGKQSKYSKYYFQNLHPFKKYFHYNGY
jgi:hypothetical protein